MHKYSKGLRAGTFKQNFPMFNLEVDVAPHRLDGRVFDQLAEELQTSLAHMPIERPANSTRES